MCQGECKEATSRRHQRGAEEERSIRADHLEHVFVLDLEIIALAAGAHDRVGQRGLVDAVLDEGLVDMGSR